MNITITPTSKRARERVKQHGEVMRLKREGTFQGEPAILVESLGETWSCSGTKHKWTGWFTNKEARWS
jgi:hypothetical protein